MENVRKNNISSMEKESMETQIISIFDLGNNGKQMLENWQALKKQNVKIEIKEFASVDVNKVLANDKSILDFVLELLLLIEEKNKEMIKHRQAVGIAKARENGIQFGRKPMAIPKEFRDIYTQVATKKISIAKATKLLNIDFKTYKKWEKQWLK